MPVLSTSDARKMFSAYHDRRMFRILLLGVMSGFPWVLIGSALTLWLKEDGLSRSA
ncbi:MAG: MFS transporter, partial [Candidatus Puniceispirillum sp.]